MFAVAREVDLQCLVHRGGGLPPVPIEGPVAEPPVGVVFDVLAGGSAERRSAVRAWLAPSLASRVTTLPDDALAVVLVRVLSAFSEDEAAAATRVPAGDEVDLMRAVFGVARTLGMTPADVLAMPWGQFLDAGRFVHDARRAEMVDAAIAARVAQADREGWKSFMGSMGVDQRRPARLTDAEREVAKRQSEMVRAQLDRMRRTGSPQPQSAEERDAHNAVLADMTAALSADGEA